MDPYITSRRYYLNSGPDGSVRIVYELDTYKNYPRGRTDLEKVVNRPQAENSKFCNVLKIA